MDLNGAKKIFLEATDYNGRVARSCANDFVRIGKFEHMDSVFRAALEDLLREGVLEQIPTTGKFTTLITYKRAAVSKSMSQVE